MAFAERNGAYFGYDLTVDGEVVRFGDAPEDTRPTSSAGTSSRSSGIGSWSSLFGYFAPFAPHGPATPHRGTSAQTCGPGPHHAGINERDALDKPTWTGSCCCADRAPGPPPRPGEASGQDADGVDEAVARILNGDAGDGRTDTLYVLVADQGIAWGEHRWTFKGDPYEPSIREALVLRWDGHIVAGVRSRASCRTSTSPPPWPRSPSRPCTTDPRSPPVRRRWRIPPVRPHRVPGTVPNGETHAADVLRDPRAAVQVRPVRDPRGGAVCARS